MQKGMKKVAILAIMGMMLASPAAVALSPGHETSAASTPAVQFLIPPNQYFGDILAGMALNASQNTTFFAPFVYNVTSFSVTGKFVTFKFFRGSGSTWMELFDVHVNQTPFANVSRTVYTQFEILSSGQQFNYGVAGSIFYAYSESALVIVHNDPQALIQVYTYEQNASVVAYLSQGLRPSSRYINQPSLNGTVTSNGTVAMMFNDTELSGYMVSEGNDFSDQVMTGGSYFVTKSIPGGSYLNAFDVPNGDSPLASAMVTIAQGLRSNTIAYYAAVSLHNGQPSIDAAYYNNQLRVSQISVSQGELGLQLTPLQTGVPNTIVLVVSNSIFNGSSSRLLVNVNGVPVVNVKSLLSVVNPYGNSTMQNITTVGSHTIITVYSPTPINSLSIGVQKTAPENLLLTVVAPIASALIIISAASVLLFRRKRNSRE